MRQELKKIVSRVRKAQDAILNGKNTDRTASLSIDADWSTWIDKPYIIIWAHNHHEPNQCTAAEELLFNEYTTPEEAEERLKVLSEVIGYEI